MIQAIGMLFLLLFMALIGLHDVIIFKLDAWLIHKASKDDIKNYLSKNDFYIWKQHQTK